MKKIIKILLLLSVVVFAASASADWNDPTEAPPGGNVEAPINVSLAPQIKDGGLAVGGVFRALFKMLVGGAAGETPSIGTQAAPAGQPLLLDVEGAIGADYYCDANGNNCVPSPLGTGTSTSGVSRIVAGQNITISPTTGVGVVTINSTASSTGSGAGDNLGNHIATQLLKMGTNPVALDSGAGDWTGSLFRFLSNGAAEIQNRTTAGAPALLVRGHLNSPFARTPIFEVRRARENAPIFSVENDANICLNGSCISAWPTGGSGSGSSGVSSIVGTRGTTANNTTGTPQTGQVSIGLRADCSSGQVLKWNGTTWNCFDDLTGGTGSGGGITTVMAGRSLSGGGSGSTVTLDVDVSTHRGMTFYNDQIALKTCNSGEVLKFNSTNSSWDCAPDNTGSSSGGGDNLGNHSATQQLNMNGHAINLGGVSRTTWPSGGISSVNVYNVYRSTWANGVSQGSVTCSSGRAVGCLVDCAATGNVRGTWLSTDERTCNAECTPGSDRRIDSMTAICIEQAS